MSESILSVEGLVKTYPSFALNEVSFCIPRGYIMGFVGRNGAGKSTTIKCIMDFISYEAGDIRIFGTNHRQQGDELRNKIGYVSEEPYFYEDMSVAWTGGFVGSFYRDWNPKEFQRLITMFGVSPEKKVKDCSKGMKVKLALAIAIAHQPELLILDEPTSGLDPVVRAELLEVFRELIQDERCSIFFSSHISSDVEKVADYITVIEQGSILISEDKHAILDQWVVVKGDRRYWDQEWGRLLIGGKIGEYGFSGVTSDPRRFHRQFRERFPQGDFQTEKISLDELLVRIAKKEEEEWAN